MLRDRVIEGPPVTLELRIGDEPIVIELRDGTTSVSLGPGSDPTATLTGPEEAILGLLVGSLELNQAEARGVSLVGDRAVVGLFSAQA
jgi:hypothetical protein